MADSSRTLPAWTCNICLEESQNPVCTSCGHLFCWPCLYPWVHDMGKPCPVCRSSLTLRDSIIPVYVTTQAEPPQAANGATAAATIPPRPHPRAPTTSISAPDGQFSSRVQRYRETVSRVRRQEAEQRAWFAAEEERNSQSINSLRADACSLTLMMLELEELRWRTRVLLVSTSAASRTTGQASTRNSLSHGVLDTVTDRAAHAGSEARRRVLNAILGLRRR